MRKTIEREVEGEERKVGGVRSFQSFAFLISRIGTTTTISTTSCTTFGPFGKAHVLSCQYRAAEMGR